MIRNIVATTEKGANTADIPMPEYIVVPGSDPVRYLLRMPGGNEIWVDPIELIAIRFGFAEGDPVPQSVIFMTKDVPMAQAPVNGHTAFDLFTQVVDRLVWFEGEKPRPAPSPSKSMGFGS